jgi:histone deacetylase 11
MSSTAQTCMTVLLAMTSWKSICGQQATDPPYQAQVSFVYSSDYVISLGGLEKLHPFDISKFEKIYQALKSDQLIRDSQIFCPPEATTEQLELVHTKDYLQNKLVDRKNLIRYMEAPSALLHAPIDLQQGVLKPFRLATGGTILAAEKALESGIGINLGGGFHHAKPDCGEGFCVYADIAIAIRWLQQEGKIKRAVVVDVDAHQGNGTIVCFSGDESVYTFSMHEGGIYPDPKETGSLDVELQAGIGDTEYMQLLKQHLPKVLEQAEADVCLIVGGCDTLDGDPLANLKMTHQGIVQRDAWIVQECVKRKLPVVFTTSGGYSADAWQAQYKSIANLIRVYGITGSPVRDQDAESEHPKPPTVAEELKRRAPRIKRYNKS